MPIHPSLFHIDHLGIMMMLLIGFVGVSVASFAMRYLDGDRQKYRFFILQICLIFAVFIMVCADHILLLWLSMMAANICLAFLMQHKHQWRAARASAYLAIIYFLIGSLFLGVAFIILYALSGQASIQAIIHSSLSPFYVGVCGILIFIAAIVQSALWPCHRWLLSSLNSPTPVSAMMHAGLVNGGGFLLMRFSPLFFDQAWMLDIVFILGMITAFLGILWKLMQHDIKRALACSTMGQMGFMMVQCGLGLFAAAAAHLCWHGLFKAYLFLASGSAAQEKRKITYYPPKLIDFLWAFLCGIAGAWAFCFVSHQPIWHGHIMTDAHLFLVVLALIAGTQFALAMTLDGQILRDRMGGIFYGCMTLIITMVMGGFYGISVDFIELFLPVGFDMPQSLGILHFVGLGGLIASWLLILFGRHIVHTDHCPNWLLFLYVRMLNQSQPHPKTVTSHRCHYEL